MRYCLRKEFHEEYYDVPLFEPVHFLHRLNFDQVLLTCKYYEYVELQNMYETFSHH